MNLKTWIRLAPVFFRCIGKLPPSYLVYLARVLQGEHPQYHHGRTWINTFFPPYPSAAFDRFLQSVINRRRAPISAYFAVTDACPYSCGHCSYGRRQSGQLDTQRALAVIDQIQSIGAITIGLTGGEPLTRPDLAQLVQAIGPHCSSVLFTTGWQLTDDRARQLRDAGLNAILIGLESDNAGDHDSTRGVTGSFATGLAALQTALRYGFHTGISTVATRQKLRQETLPRMARLAGQYGAHEFRILEPAATGQWRGHTDELLRADESLELARFHQQWNRHHRDPAIACFSHLESDRLFGCGAGYHHLFIDARGEVCPCDLTPLSFGNALREPLSAIWQRMGQWFGRPRCGCLMKELCRSSLNQTLNQADSLPLEPPASQAVCRQLSATPLPAIYARLFKDHIPADRPRNPV